MTETNYDEDIEESMYELIEKLMDKYSLTEEDTLEILKEYFQPPPTSSFSFIIR